MKNKIYLITVFLLTLMLSTQSCKKNKEKDEENTTNILPTSFKVDIPSSISSSTPTKSASLKAANDSVLNGDSIYQHLRMFIAIGEGSADIVQAIMNAIYKYNINKAMSITYTSDEDGRAKNLDVYENATIDGTIWEYYLIIKDASFVTNDDKGVAMQIMWNTNPVKGIAILKPKNINVNDVKTGDAMFKIEYSEAGDIPSYDKYMIVSISGLPKDITNQYSMTTIKMFAGKKGNVVDVYGNSTHPYAKFRTSNTGFSWSFAASGNDATNIGVAEVGLPPIDLNDGTRSTILGTYSLKEVFKKEIKSWLPWVSDVNINNYLNNAGGPGYFDNGGFVKAEVAPNTNYTDLVSRLANLTPYKPYDVTNLAVKFY